MTQHQQPNSEEARLAELRGLRLLDTGPSPSFDAITTAATEMFDVGISAVSLMDAERQWFKSAVGFGSLTQTPRDVAFCALAVATGKYLEVSDAAHDVRFASNPLVVGEPHIRFYASAPIISPKGNVLGTVCILDCVPRTLTAAERTMLHHFAALASALCAEHAYRRDTLDNVEVVLETIDDAVVAVDNDGLITFINPAARSITGWTHADAIGTPVTEVIILQDGNGNDIDCPTATCLASGEGRRAALDAVLLSKNGTAVPIEESVALMVDAAGIQKGAAIVFRDVTEERLLRDELVFIAEHDSLTGLFNRRAFERRANAAIAELHTPELSHAVLYLDLDGFKLANDEFGHAGGDDLLQRFAKHVQAAAGPTATVARLGGDEFGVLLQDVGTADAMRMAQSIADSTPSIGRAFDAAIRIGVSVGVAPITTCTTELADALKQADNACYQAKAAGGSRAQLFRDVNEPKVLNLRPAVDLTEHPAWASRDRLAEREA